MILSLNLYRFLVALNKGGESFYSAVKFAFDGAFPYGGDAVTQERKVPICLDVAHDVIRELFVPKFRIAFGATRELAAVLMPKTAVNEYDRVVLENEHVRRSRQIAPV